MALLPPPPPPLPKGASDEVSLQAVHEQRQAKRIRQGSLKILHMAFHPGCKDQECAIDHGDTTCLGRGDETVSSDAAALEEENAADARQPVNLNVRGALLHLATDVIRSIVMFVAGILVLIG